MPQRLADRLPLGLELLPDLTVFVPGLWKLLGANLVEPRAPVGDGVADDGVGYREPAAADPGGRLEHFVEPALRLADRLGDVGYVDDAVGVEVRPVPQHLDDVGSAARLDGGSDPRLQIVGGV